ncbi:MAG: PD-(D/E)XK nuclease family protein [Muribaculaceae bacterium]|nr:PD-(D/E)XK nuclease family protein [Muribaculaceae bacterium]
MIPFLQQVASHYLKEAQHLEDYCFVFPNRRSGQFFIHYLQQELVAADRSKGVLQPHLMPHVTSIAELVTRLTNTVAATEIEMFFALYDAYCEALGDRAQEFDRFIYWAHLIVSDFNDIDRSLANPDEIYRNLEDLHALSSNYLTPEVKEKVRKIFGDDLFTAFFDTDADASLWRLFDQSEKPDDEDKKTAVKQEFLSLWNALSTIYANYHKALEMKGVTSPGKQLRNATQAPFDKLPYTRIAFVGFGVLSAAEVQLFQRFKLEGKTDFWWDYAGIADLLAVAPHDPGALLIDGYCKSFGAQSIAALEGEGPKMRVVTVPSTVGQAKVAFDEVSAMHGGSSSIGIDTAIVLPDESLLVPLLHSVSGVEKLNVTLGYPLRNSEVVSLMHIVSRMHHQATKEKDEWNYYREDVNDILSHPLIKTCFTHEALAMAQELARTNRFRVPASEFAGLSFKDLFTPAMDSGDEGDVKDQQTEYVNHLLAFCNLLLERMPSLAEADESAENQEDGVVLPLQHAFLMMYIDVLNQLKRALAECRQSLQRGTVFYLIDRLMSSLIVPFTGEPLQGLQIMGLLETRSLDFDHVVILSMNERVFPRRHSVNSFIPNYMRRVHGMSTIEQQEAIVSFNFYRLLNRARQVTFVCDSSAQKMGSSEPSRFIAQLEKVYGRPMHHVEMNLDVSLASPIAIEVPNPGYASLREQYLSHRDYAHEWYLSASAINEYISCPLLFYIHNIKGLNSDNDVTDFMDSGTFGTIVHDTLRDFYYSPASRQRGGLFTRDDIVSFRKSGKEEAVVVRNIKKNYLHVPVDQLDSDTQPLRGEAYMLIDTIKSYVDFVLDYDLELIDRTGPFTVLECEVSHQIHDMEVGTAKFHFTYKADRIDRLADGTVRIVDYKTGKDTVHFNTMDDLFNPKKEKSDKGRRKAILQLFLYCYAYLLEHPEVEQVMPVIYKIPLMKDSGVKMGTSALGRQYLFTMSDFVAQDFIAQMGPKVTDIFELPFNQAEDGAKACDYCRFIDYCRRKPSKR